MAAVIVCVRLTTTTLIVDGLLADWWQELDGSYGSTGVELGQVQTSYVQVPAIAATYTKNSQQLPATHKKLARGEERWQWAAGTTPQNTNWLMDQTSTTIHCTHIESVWACWKTVFYYTVLILFSGLWTTQNIKPASVLTVTPAPQIKYYRLVLVLRATVSLVLQKAKKHKK